MRDIAIGKGIGKFKGEFDLKRLTGVVIPPKCEDVCPKASTVKCDVDCIDWHKDTSVPPLTEQARAEIVQKVTKYDHDAECRCDAGNILGDACHVLCPSKNDNICAARGPDLPSAAPGMKHDSWVGDLIYKLGAWVESKAGCLWGEKNAAGNMPNGFTSEESSDAFHRDPFVEASPSPTEPLT